MNPGYRRRIQDVFGANRAKGEMRVLARGLCSSHPTIRAPLMPTAAKTCCRAFLPNRRSGFVACRMPDALGQRSFNTGADAVLLFPCRVIRSAEQGVADLRRQAKDE